MSKVKERKHGVEPDRPTTVEDHELPPLETIERPAEFTPAATTPTPSKFIRWMGWLLGALALVGIGAVVWWAAFSSNPAEMTDLEAWHRTEVASATVSNHTNLETWHRQEVARTVAPLTAPAEIDPRVSPEILRAFPVTDASSWSLESLELLRALPTQGIDGLSLESLRLLRGLPVMIPAEIDPHESPEILRAFPVTDVSSWSLESLYLLRSLPTQGIDELSLESLQLLRSLPVMIPAEIDPHESPEIIRSRIP